MRRRSADGRILDHITQIIQEGIVHLIVGQCFLPMVADQVIEPKGEPLLQQGQAPRTWPGFRISRPGLQLRAEDLRIALLQQLNGVLPALVEGEEVETRLKGPRRQRPIGLQLLSSLDEGLARLDLDGAAADDLHRSSGDRSWKRRRASQGGPLIVCTWLRLGLFAGRLDVDGAQSAQRRSDSQASPSPLLSR